MKRRHHYVPRFFLRAFASADRRIHLYNLAGRKTVQDASLRDQCFKHRMYGEDDMLEDALSVIEGAAAQVIGKIHVRGECPPLGTEEHIVLRVFLGYQLLRTTAALGHVVAHSKAVERAVFDGKTPQSWGAAEDQALLICLRSAPLFAGALTDLESTLVQAPPDHSFVTSDKPVFRYNCYCQGITGTGVTGAHSSGFMLICPLSPQLLLLLFDSEVYKVGSRRQSSHVNARPVDVHAFSRIQFVAAQDNVYFSDWRFATQCNALATGVVKIRAASRPHVNIAVSELNEREELLHSYWPMPDLGLDLSFLSIKREARRVELFARSRRVRRPYTNAALDLAEGQFTRYVVRKRQ